MPVSSAALAAHLARAALDARPAVGRSGGHAVRIGIDGPVPADTGALADAVAAALTELAIPVARASAEHYLRARSLRLEHGRDDPRTFYRGWYDTAALRREVLDPLGPDGLGRWLPRLRDPDTDRPLRDVARAVPAGAVAVVEGRFLGRRQLAGAVDLLVHLDVSPAAVLRRLPEHERGAVPREVVAQAWGLYLAECAPADRADQVVRFDHPDRPALVGAARRWSGGSRSSGSRPRPT